ncbi:MAG: dipeptidyl carboxypeptidase II, partial [Xanthomonadaceae bacterium]|nr:dipeptidyl carboxypeptidase II [Xanthomonadaceae bacterium]
MTLTRLTLASAICLALGLSACSPDGTPSAPAESTSAAAGSTASEAAQANPFFSASALPLQTPDFRLIREEHYLPAIEEGMKRQLIEIRAIADNPEPASVANTLEAMERSGDLLTRVTQVFFNIVGTDSNDALRKIQSEVAPKMAAHQDAILLDS